MGKKICKTKHPRNLGSEKIVRTYVQCTGPHNISSIKRVTRKFLEVSRCRRAKQRQRNVQKKCAARAKMVFFLLFSLSSSHG